MNKKEFFIANILIIVLVFSVGASAFNTFSNQDIRSLLYSNTKDASLQLIQENLETSVESGSGSLGEGESATPQTVTESRCSSKDPLPLISQQDPSITTLSHYQELCHSFAFGSMMVFTVFPENTISAPSEALKMREQLRRFQENGISPIVVVEPYAGDNLLSYKSFLAGKYDQALEVYFDTLRQSGVTDEMMGMWVPFPESNTPNWNNKGTTPQDFSLCVNKYLSVLKKHFPKAKGSILLNAATYEPDDEEWNNGDYLEFSPYLDHIEPGLVDSFGIQGFPWISNAAQESRKIFKASEFLQTNLAIPAAQQLHTKDIWFNTGSFAAKYVDVPEKTARVSLNERKAILNGIIEEVQSIREYQLNEYRVSLNLFAEDKSRFEEATDWSYFQDDDSRALLFEFLKKAHELEILVSLFDRKSIESDGAPLSDPIPQETGI